MTLTSSHILTNWNDGIHYNGDIDDLIDAIYEEERVWHILEDVLDKFLPDLDDDKKTDILIDMTTELEKYWEE